MSQEGGERQRPGDRRAEGAGRALGCRACERALRCGGDQLISSPELEQVTNILNVADHHDRRKESPGQSHPCS